MLLASSVQKRLLLILIASSLPCLRHAKSLKSIKSRRCSPDSDQLNLYNRLYRANAVNTFNGNIVYYALKAAEVEENMTEPMHITEEDKTAVANVSASDQSRFAPAGMEMANKVVCAKILQEMDAEASLISDTAPCAWDYICDYKADRFPNYFFKARCKTSKCSINCSKRNTEVNSKYNMRMCQSHGIHVAVLQMRNNCEETVWGQELLPIVCTCTNEAMMNVAS